MKATHAFFSRFLLCVAALLLAHGISHAAAFETDEPDMPFLTPPQEALLTLFYNASTYGELHPCPT